VNGKASPSMNVVLGVQVPRKETIPNEAKLQLRVGDHAWGGSRERNRGPMNKNRIGGGAERGERAVDAKPRWSKLRLRRSGGRAAMETFLAGEISPRA